MTVSSFISVSITGNINSTTTTTPMTATSAPSSSSSPSTYQSPKDDWNVIRTSIIIYMPLFIGIVLLFSYVRMRFPKVYQIRPYNGRPTTGRTGSKKRNNYQKQNHTWYFHRIRKSLPAFIVIPDAEFFAVCGMDALCLLRILRMGTYLSLASVMCSIFLVPVYHQLNDNNMEDTDAFVSTTITHLPDGSSAFTATVVASYIIIGFTLFLLHSDFQWFIVQREKFLSRTNARNYTIYVTGIPLAYRTDTKLAEYFRRVIAPDVVHSAVVVRHIPSTLRTVVDRYNTITLTLERLHTMRKNDCDQKEEPMHFVVGKTKNGGPLVDRVPAIPYYTQQLLQIHMELKDLQPLWMAILPETTESAAATITTLSTLKTQVPKHSNVIIDVCYREERSTTTIRREPASEQQNVFVSTATMASGVFPDNRETCISSIHDGEEPEQSEMIFHRNVTTDEEKESAALDPHKIDDDFRSIASAIHRSNDESGQQQQQFYSTEWLQSGGCHHSRWNIDEGHNNALPLELMPPRPPHDTDTMNIAAAETHNNHCRYDITNQEVKYLDAAFVTFRKLSAVAVALQTVHSTFPYQMEVTEAPFPDQILWNNVGLSHRVVLQLRRWMAFAMTTLLCVFWTVPVTFLVSLTEIQVLQQKLPFLEDWLVTAPWLEPFINQISPLLLSFLNSVVVPMLLRLFSTVEGVVGKSQQEASLFLKLATFQLIQTFCVASLAGGVTSALAEVNEVGDIFLHLAKTLPPQSVYFMQLVLIQTVIGLGSEMLRTTALLQALLRSRIGPRVTETDRQQVFLGLRPLSNPRYFLHAQVLAGTSLRFMVLFTFSVLSPFVAYVLLFSFLALEIGFKHQFIHIYPPTLDSGGQLWMTFIMVIIVCMTVSEIVLITFMALSKATSQAYALIPLLISTALFLCYLSERHFKVAKFLSLETCDHVDHANCTHNCDADSLECFKKKYYQPELIMIEKLFETSSSEMSEPLNHINP